jgi:NADPH-dependent 2,4-dienoyl-CoA reductase/sulfur reductase-like enzyme
MGNLNIWCSVLLFYFLLATEVVFGLPGSQSKLLKRSDEVKDTYDYVIVGGGTAGLTVADRLTEDGKCKCPKIPVIDPRERPLTNVFAEDTVLVIEHGTYGISTF